MNDIEYTAEEMEMIEKGTIKGDGDAPLTLDEVGDKITALHRQTRDPEVVDKNSRLVLKTVAKFATELPDDAQLEGVIFLAHGKDNAHNHMTMAGAVDDLAQSLNHTLIASGANPLVLLGQEGAQVAIRMLIPMVMQGMQMFGNFGMPPGGAGGPPVFDPSVFFGTDEDEDDEA